MSFIPECPMFEQKKYQCDNVFKQMEKDHLTEADRVRKENTDLLKEIIKMNFISLMRRDQLFELIFDRIDIGGSYYKGTKYGQSDEVELHLVHKLDNIKSTIDSNHPKDGYVKIKLHYCRVRDPNRDELSKITDDNNYLDQKKFQDWLDGVFAMALDTFYTSEPLYFAPSAHALQYNGIKYYMNRIKPGPTFTVIFTNSKYKSVDVKLVSAFEFNGVQLDSLYHRYNQNIPFRVTLKPFPGYGSNSDLYWRLSFLENEKDMLRDEVRPVIKLIKKLRDAHNLKSITGYQIETIFFHEMFKYRNNLPQFLGASKTYLLIHGLKELVAALEKGQLDSFWNRAYSLIDSSNPNYYDHVRRLRDILEEIDSKIEKDPYAIWRLFPI